MPPTVAEGAKLAVVYEEAKKFFEGPAWNPKEQKLYFTSFGGKTSLKVMRLEEPGKAIVWLDHTEGVNGTWLGQDGRLIGAQAYGHRVMSYDLGGDGPKDPKALYENVELHQPNDVCQTPNGDIYFSDPDFKGKTASAVYVLKPDGAVKKVLTDMAVTNGLIASLDGKTLYVGDSHKKHWRAYPILEDGTVGEGKLFFEPKTESKADPDGMSIDEKGNLYFTGMGGVWVVAPDGAALGFIPIPEFCSNVTFGGSDGKTLYCTCSGKVYSLAMNLRGGAFATHK
ncbi:MAG: SMP-30/gluconolactonase/LRE family protein [Planctomycetota bacterium]|nr:SMP-30/gluconolactonase/LRE family protein [Planctomycetota bacterium]